MPPHTLTMRALSHFVRKPAVSFYWTTRRLAPCAISVKHTHFKGILACVQHCTSCHKVLTSRSNWWTSLPRSSVHDVGDSGGDRAPHRLPRPRHLPLDRLQEAKALLPRYQLRQNSAGRLSLPSLPLLPPCPSLVGHSWIPATVIPALWGAVFRLLCNYKGSWSGATKYYFPTQTRASRDVNFLNHLFSSDSLLMTQSEKP